MEQGVIFNIQRFAVHDGPGIRTTVFLKGCPLACSWCHNPESRFHEPQVLVNSERCQGCGTCLELCPEGAPAFWAGRRVAAFCAACGDCVEHCPHGALELVGSSWTVEQVLKEVMKDELFYDESGGGVTFSGGEPFAQPRFLLALLQASKEKGLHTAVDTCGYAPWEEIALAAPFVDMFLYDLKLMDNERHHDHTGRGNEQILANLEKLCGLHKRVEVRFPLIPGITDDEENLAELAAFLRPLPILGLRVLPYHAFGAAKYARLGLEYRLPTVKAPEPHHLRRVQDFLRREGINVLEEAFADRQRDCPEIIR